MDEAITVINLKRQAALLVSELLLEDIKMGVLVFAASVWKRSRRPCKIEGRT